MNPDHIFWFALTIYAFHILEEYSYDWKTWSGKVLKISVDWNYYFVGQLVFLFVGLACAQVGWAHPTFALMFPAFLIVDGIVFHAVPYIRSKRKFSPGMFTAILLFLPLGLKCFTLAREMEVFTKSLIIAGVGGVLMLAFPAFLLKTRNLEFFKP
jgi:hypothetical protein